MSRRIELNYIRLEPGGVYGEIHVESINYEPEMNYLDVLRHLFPLGTEFICVGEREHAVAFTARAEYKPLPGEEGVRDWMHEFLLQIGLCRPEDLFSLPNYRTIIFGRVPGENILRTLDLEELEGLLALHRVMASSSRQSSRQEKRRAEEDEMEEETPSKKRRR